MSDAGGSRSPHAYHHATKHGFGRFAKSLGYLDWANQPNPFRRFAGTPVTQLPKTASVRDVPYEALYTDKVPTEAVCPATIGEFLRCALGLSAWKAYGSSRWALRVNPSSGNLHPTEGYLVWDGGVYHYAPDEHVLEQRAELPGTGWASPRADGSGTSAAFLIALTSIHWREAWKYGERAFRYCQHDIGHALGALRFSAAMLGWGLTVLPAWSHADVATMLGLDREQDFPDAEREEPALIALVSAAPLDALNVDPAPLIDAARGAHWQGRANRLSAVHADWPLIEEVARATIDPGVEPVEPNALRSTGYFGAAEQPRARAIILGRRSATAFDPRGMLRKDTFIGMLERLVPSAPPWDALTWPPQVHLALFVHRVEDVPAGIYAYLRSSGDVSADLKTRMRADFLWEPLAREGKAQGLFLLAPLDVRTLANRLSCDQDIAGDGFFSLGMLAHMATVRDQGGWMYRRLFWECGLIGQVLYLEAEAAGARATGIGCFYDDPVHDVLGLRGDEWQSLYHFSMGVPVDDSRLTTSPGYDWEQSLAREP